MNARVSGGRVVKAGEQIVLGGNESYVALCRRHWTKGELAPLEIRRISAGKERFMPLLLEADPSRKMIDRYLEDGELYALMVDGLPSGVAVVTRRDDGALELKNLATAPDKRGMGYGANLLRHVIKLCSARSDALYVGTSPANVPFYKKFGFETAYTAVGFFTDNYDEPIIENGEALTDMLYMMRKL